jgi:hypothetical protein
MSHQTIDTLTFEVFRAACREGRLTAQTESDFGADLSA